jgi:cytochrome c oxidase cbb3-type subunit 3
MNASDLEYLIFMLTRRLIFVLMFAVLICPLLEGQGHKASAPPDKGDNDESAMVARGKSAFRSSCGFCHGEDATGSRAPDLVRSAILSHDEHGNLIIPVIKGGRPDKGMPAFSTLKDNQIADIVAFLHHQADEALHSANVPGDYPLAKMLTGNAAAGKAYFEGAGGCTGCHSVTKDLAGIANKYKPVDLQQHIVYPSRDEEDSRTAVVTTNDGQRYEGKLKNIDEFSIGIMCQDGWYRSWPRDQVKAEVKDPLEAHRELMGKYTDADIHNLFAYLETVK